MVCNKNILICRLWFESDNNEEFAKKLEEHGILYFKANRAVIVPVPAMMCPDLKEDFTDDVLVLYVFGDPASGCMLCDTVIITGYRFGVDDIILNCQPIYSVHEDYGSTIKYTLEELEKHILIDLADPDVVGCKLCIRGRCIGNEVIIRIAEVCLKILKWLFRKFGGKDHEGA